MTLLLDGTQVRGHRLKVTASLKIESGDMSGQTSNTDSADKGFKPKSLQVAMTIRYKDAQDLQTLISLAEKVGSGGERHTYRVVNDTAQAFGVRQAQFSEGVSAREDDSLAQWIIQFTLTERLSNPEKTEQRRAKSGVSAQSGPGSSVSGTAGGTAGGSAGGSSTELTGFESVLKRVDDWLGPAPGASS